MNGGYLAVSGNLSGDAINTILGNTRVGDSSSSTSAVLGSNIYTTYFASDSGRDISGYDVSNCTVIYTSALPENSIPEPSTFAFFGGLGALGLVLIRRRHQTA